VPLKLVPYIFFMALGMSTVTSAWV